MKKISMALLPALLTICFISCQQVKSDDVPRKIQFTTSSSSGSETVDTVAIAVSIDRADSEHPISVDYHVKSSSTATAGGVDFVLSPGTVTFAPNSTSATIILTVVKDDFNEQDETVVIALNNAVNSVLGPDSIYTYTIDNYVDKDLVLYLPLDGNANDASSYNHSNIFSNISFGNDRLSQGSAAGVFDSTTTYLQVPNDDVLDTLKDVTLAAWVLPISFYGTGSNPVIHKSSTASSFQPPYNQYHLAFTGDKYWHYQGVVDFSLSVNDVYTQVTSPSYTWMPGTWIHVAATYDGNDLRLYINGVLNATVNAPGEMGHFGNDVFIGRIAFQNDTPHNLPGTFDEIRIYSRALNADEIKSVYNQQDIASH